MYYFAMSMLNNPTEAQDTVGETVLKAFERRCQLRKRESAKAWIMQIVANEAKKILRHRKRTVSLEEEMLEKAVKEVIYRVFQVDMSQAICSLTASSYRDADNELIQTAYVELETEGNRYAVTMDLDQEKVVCLYDDGAEPAYEMQDITWNEKMIMAEVSYAKDVAIRYTQDNAVHPKMILYEMDESGIKKKNGVAQV